MQGHVQCMEKIGTKILEWKGLTLDTYIDTMSDYNQPLDEIAILTFARMYQCSYCHTSGMVVIGEQAKNQ